MKIAIHQPNFIPWLGYFQKIKAADLFILYDTAEYTKNSFINRNKMIINEEEKWITIPIIYKGFSNSAIKDVRIHPTDFKPEKIITTIEHAYKRFPHYEKYSPVFNECLREALDTGKIVDLNEKIIRWSCQVLGIETPIISASTIQTHSNDATEYIIELCLKSKGEIYISGKSGKNYLREELFEQAGVKLTYFDSDSVRERYGYLSSLYWIYLKGKEIKL